MRRRLLVFCACVAVSGITGGAKAADPGLTGEGGLECRVSGNDVALSWNIVFFAPIEAWRVWRDGVLIAQLEPGASSYRDPGVTDGEHLYELDAVNASPDPDLGSSDGVQRLARCVVVVGDFRLDCAVADNRVKIAWEPILIDILVTSLIVTRNGEVIATLPPDRTEFLDAVPGPGLYRYVVRAESGPGHSFLIGACTVEVPRTGFVCLVDPPRVIVDWSRVPLPAVVIGSFLVVRDGEVIGMTRESRFVDSPGIGEHHYRVFALFGPEPIPEPLPADAEQVDGTWRLLVGECKIFMPGDSVPPPEDLTCVNLDAPANIVLDAEELLGPSDILLVWQIPRNTNYDWVVISRNDIVLARIPGSQFYYVDRNVPTGTHVYSVTGLVRGQASPPAKCEITVPFSPLPPPRDLHCEYVGLTDELDDTASDPDGFVQLRWVNGALYEWVVIVRNGRTLGRIPGSATSYRDPTPVPGVSTYGVFGVLGIRRSAQAECEVDVPVGQVPPPEDLVCRLVWPTDPVPVDPDNPDDNVTGEGDILSGTTVFLRWVNPVAYDRVLILRNNMQIALLPGDSRSYIDHPPFVGGKVVYSVFGLILDGRSRPATCEVDLGPPFVPPPRDFQCQVANVVIDPETGDVVDPSDDPDASILPVVRLSWINPIRYTALVLSRDGVHLARLPGDSTTHFDRGVPAGLHVYTLWGIDREGNESTRVACEVEVSPVIVPPVRDLTCVVVETSAQGPVAVLRWRNAARYDRILVSRNGELVATLSGEATRFNDPGLDPGVYEYSVTAVIGNRRSLPAWCRVVVEGPGPRNLLYFSSGIFEPVDPQRFEEIVPELIDGGGSVQCLASNSRPIQGWSFGVCHDPRLLSLAEATIAGTDTADLNGGDGPTFLVLNELDQGVSMAAIVNEQDPSQTLPSANAHSLLRLRYEAGPEGEPGIRYPVRYCETLGDPPVAIVFVVGGFEVRPETLPGFVALPQPIRLLFTRGDCNADDQMDMTDAIVTLDWLFRGGPEPGCLEAADANASGELNIADPVYNLQHLFSGGPPPPAPYPECGFALLTLGCDEPTCP